MAYNYRKYYGLNTEPEKDAEQARRAKEQRKKNQDKKDQDNEKKE